MRRYIQVVQTGMARIAFITGLLGLIASAWIVSATLDILPAVFEGISIEWVVMTGLAFDGLGVVL